MSNFKSTLDKIKKRGYWKIVIEPVYPIKKFFDHIIEAKEFINGNRIQLRSWDYPHYPTRNDEKSGINLLTNRANGYIDWNHFKEVWTYFQSGQFVHVFGLREDWFQESDWFGSEDRYSKVDPNTVLDLIGVTLSMTEILLFLSKLASDPRYKEKVHIQISLSNLEGRQLTVFDPRRVPIFSERKSTTPSIVAIDDDFSSDTLSHDHLAIARDATVDIIKYFDWPDPPVKVIEDDQQKLLTRRL
ncbi:hypothetical protein KKD03_01645 [Patescibacteria group bacterium]|nr:hypothetical protein [Patescibacteria group bacterium]